MVRRAPGRDRNDWFSVTRTRSARRARRDQRHASQPTWVTSSCCVQRRATPSWRGGVRALWPPTEEHDKTAEDPTSVTDVLDSLRDSRREALDGLLPVVYQQLREIAHRHVAARGGGGSLAT